MDRGEKMRFSSTCCGLHSDKSFCPKAFTEFAVDNGSPMKIECMLFEFRRNAVADRAKRKGYDDK